jgi:RimJ/RimL family protein N-acetyltransferase
MVEKKVFTDGRIILRPIGIEDVEQLYEAINESTQELSPWLSFVHPDYSIKDTKEWLARRDQEWQDGAEYSFAIIDYENGTFLGGCGLNYISGEFKMANVGYWVRTSKTKQGIAPAATLILSRFAFEELGLNRIEILAEVDNKKSQRVAEKAGAKREGIMRNRLCFRGNARDVVMFSLIPDDLKKLSQTNSTLQD